ncbi:MAG: glycosyltransferase, partial [Elusimicrobiota bacterium]|nr:glycosyltransferase [Elusimicrobiota bacterium]
GRQIILFLGRLHSKKRPDIAIQAFNAVHSAAPATHLVIAGTGAPDYIVALRRMVDDLGLRSRVTFTGILLGEAKLEAFSAAKLFVLPSFRENFGISVAEAMAAGCPVVVSDGVDIAGDILESEAGLVCPPESVPFAAAMNKILRTPGLGETMGGNGKRLVMRKYTWERVAAELSGIYDRILSGH